MPSGRPLVASDPLVAVVRIVLIVLGIAFVYLGAKGASFEAKLGTHEFLYKNIIERLKDA